ncbi:MAG: M3 family metallopeptidase [Bacilli bacterium]|nr:M3 family metallopeptidase [Bacilli bacterium]
MNYKSRSDVPSKYKWDLTKRFRNEKQWHQLFEKTMSKIKAFEIYKASVTKSRESLCEVLNNYYDIQNDVIKLTAYAMLVLDEDLNNNDSIRLNNLGNKIESDFAVSTSFVEPEILKADEKTIEEYLRSYKPLEKYSYYLKKLLRKKVHILNSDEERIISTLSTGYNNLATINSTLLNSEINYGTIVDDNGYRIQLIPNNMRNYLKNSERKVRKNTYFKSYKARAQFQKTIGANLINYMNYVDKIAKLHNYDNAIDMIFQSSDIPYEVNQTLNKVASQRIDGFRKYYNSLKKHLNINTLEHYDKMASPFNIDKTYTIEEATKMIKEALSILGTEYSLIIAKAFDEKWIDFCSYKGKIAGAYCLSNYGDTPVVLVNYQGRIEDVSTIVHELGHAVNGCFRLENNYINNYFTDLIMGEITSLTNEILFSNYILKNSNDNEIKKVVLHKLIDTIHNNLFGACLEGELENIVYEKMSNGETLTPDDLNDITISLNNKYYGDIIKQNKYMGYLWMSRSHYFIPFYLYKYAVSVSVACYVGKEIVSGNEEIKKRYIDFLHFGKDDSVVNLIKKLGVDITKEDVYQRAIDYYEELLDNLDALM